MIMDVNNIVNLATNMAQERSGQVIGVTVLKKALDMQADGAMALIDALPSAPQNLPPNLGQSVNTTA